MAFDIHLLSELSYDEAEPKLDEYIQGALDHFVASQVSQAYCQQHPKGGFWIGTFIEFAFLYGEMTLPKMTKGDVQQVMEYILPRKLILLDPDEADSAIPELVAFWTFLKEDYQLRSAGAIADYLQSISSQFKAWMSDPSRGGIAKNFLMDGMQSEFDMTSEAGLQEFQQVYNQRQQENQGPLPNPKIPTVSPPPETQRFIDLIGINLPTSGEGVDPSAHPPVIPNPIRALLRGNLAEEGGILSEETIQCLKTQSISATSPGPILQDFETALAFVGPAGIAVSKQRWQLGGKSLATLNQQLSQPVDIGLSRPSQKSYPNIHGLYLLLRASRLVQVVDPGRKPKLQINPEVHAAWQQLNPTEQYFTLLEAWIIQGRLEFLADERQTPLTAGDRTLKAWEDVLGKSAKRYANYREQTTLDYWPGLYNIALMEMFGFLKITTAKPTPGKGWRIRRTDPLPFGRAMFNLLRQIYVQQSGTWVSEIDDTLAFHELQPRITPYFPQWKQVLTLPRRSFRPGEYIYKVSLDQIWRRIAISAEATLADLSQLILNSVGFDADHLDQFTYQDEWGRTIEVMHPFAEDEPTTEEVLIGDIPLQEGDSMEYLFDFGDAWRFKVTLEQVKPPAPEPKNKTGKKTKPPKIRGYLLESHGKAPDQYA
ncbi:plasmid pRiA4b ORF-3 family protein [Lyngbya confervoides]|uniref:Plasmid pRiA4b ORF-3 family protein n=1 Tax=Lyngbya confervoides BDU141951 TaxID=1574623 RepID=A0ABD4T6M7_9CYAN|nr:plasmid pRiA4b ORF-3 family protein [Lyngbya confervoides]MCM1984224.1 plasmid pRiA4b ORF-3 family protein [Lyngbya confervoides BDU141951]